MSLTGLFDVPAPAKLNLFLHIVGRRDDGYHLLQSMFVLIDWCDTLHFERRTDASLARHDLSAALPADDLCLRAARLLQAESGVTHGVDISINKQVPWGAGLGGGSSDAASTLLALNRLWGLNWPLDKLLALGLKLGADVPFFLGGRNAWVEGVGERLTPLSITPQRFAVLKPAAGLETRVVFADHRLVRNTEAATIEGFTAATFGAVSLAEYGRNDLQPVAESSCSEVAQAADWLKSRYGNSRMTGSGSAVFAVCRTEGGTEGGTESRTESGTEVEVDSQQVVPFALPEGWRSRMCKSLQQHPLAQWAASSES